jgi:putative transposase
MIHTPRCYRHAAAYLRRCARWLVRRQKCGNQRKKAVKLIAKADLKVKRRRQDFHHETALQFVRQYDTL